MHDDLVRVVAAGSAHIRDAASAAASRSARTKLKMTLIITTVAHHATRCSDRAARGVCHVAKSRYSGLTNAGRRALTLQTGDHDGLSAHLDTSFSLAAAQLAYRPVARCRRGKRGGCSAC